MLRIQSKVLSWLPTSSRRQAKTKSCSWLPTTFALTWCPGVSSCRSSKSTFTLELLHRKSRSPSRHGVARSPRARRAKPPSKSQMACPMPTTGASAVLRTPMAKSRHKVSRSMKQRPACCSMASNPLRRLSHWTYSSPSPSNLSRQSSPTLPTLPSTTRAMVASPTPRTYPRLLVGSLP